MKNIGGWGPFKEKERCLLLRPGVRVLAGLTLPETNSKFAPENRPGPKRKGSSPNLHFSGAKLVFGSVMNVSFLSETFFPQKTVASTSPHYGGFVRTPSTPGT